MAKTLFRCFVVYKLKRGGGLRVFYPLWGWTPPPSHFFLPEKWIYCPGCTLYTVQAETGGGARKLKRRKESKRSRRLQYGIWYLHPQKWQVSLFYIFKSVFFGILNHFYPELDFLNKSWPFRKWVELNLSIQKFQAQFVLA